MLLFSAVAHIQTTPISHSYRADIAFPPLRSDVLDDLENKAARVDLSRIIAPTVSSSVRGLPKRSSVCPQRESVGRLVGVKRAISSGAPGAMAAI